MRHEKLEGTSISNRAEFDITPDWEMQAINGLGSRVWVSVDVICGPLCRMLQIFGAEYLTFEEAIMKSLMF